MIKWDLYHKLDYLLSMKKTKHIIVRITETQFNRLADALITEQQNKSSIVRAALDKYMDEPNKSPDKQSQSHNTNKKSI